MATWREHSPSVVVVMGVVVVGVVVSKVLGRWCGCVDGGVVMVSWWWCCDVV